MMDHNDGFGMGMQELINLCLSAAADEPDGACNQAQQTITSGGQKPSSSTHPSILKQYSSTINKWHSFLSPQQWLNRTPLQEMRMPTMCP